MGINPNCEGRPEVPKVRGVWTRKSYPRHIDCRMLSSRPCPLLATNRQAFASCASAGRLGAPSAPAAVEQLSASPGRLQPDVAGVPDGVSSDVRVQRLGARSAQVMVFVAHSQPSMWHVMACGTRMLPAHGVERMPGTTAAGDGQAFRTLWARWAQGPVSGYADRQCYGSGTGRCRQGHLWCLLSYG